MAQQRFVAFLRAVNVGGRIVKMVELKKIFQSLALDDVSTFIASGNVIFAARATPPALETKIEKGLERALQFPVQTIVRTVEEVAAAATFKAFPPAALDGASLYVGILKDAPPRSAVARALAMQTDIDQLRVHGREVYWLARKNIAQATISMAGIEKALQTPATFRNINTVRRLAAKYARD